MEVTVFNSFNNLENLLVFNGSTPQVGSEPFVYNLMQVPGSPCGPAMLSSASALPPEEDQHLLAAYPNPFTEGFSLVVEGGEADAIHIEVFNDSGHPVEMISDVTLNTQYRFGASWEPGNYILRINRGGVITSQKVIKK